jgi:hypothetical protein
VAYWIIFRFAAASVTANSPNQKQTKIGDKLLTMN